SLRALATVTRVLHSMPGATVSLKFASQNIGGSKWALSAKKRCVVHRLGKFRLLPYETTLAEAFACIAMTESGSFDLDPSTLMHVMAIASGNSLYIASRLLHDPLYDDSDAKITRVTGNLGRPGIALLVSPHQPKVKSLAEGSWQFISHNSFDCKLEDSFRETTLHLGFTEWKMPIDVGNRGLRDAEIYFLEAPVALYDHGEWVADLDILAAVSSWRLQKLRTSQAACVNNSSEFHRCSGEAETASFVSIDNWEELLDSPVEPGVVRAHGNWQARLAAAALAFQRGHNVRVLPRSPCWKCSLD
ncbi:hypothetical protein LZ32DRAFT_507856, partial [Colletotrichum eremochloae]